MDSRTGQPNAPTPSRPTAFTRRGLLLRTANALALPAVGTLFSSEIAVAGERTALQADQNQRPFSKDADIVVWGELAHGAAEPEGAFVAKALLLQGDWAAVKLTEAMAWGEGHEGKDVWTSNTKLCKKGGPYRMKLTLLPHPHCLAYYLLIVQLEAGDSASDKIAAMFRYQKGRGEEGVFAAAFRFPS